MTQGEPKQAAIPSRLLVRRGIVERVVVAWLALAWLIYGLVWLWGEMLG